MQRMDKGRLIGWAPKWGNGATLIMPRCGNWGEKVRFLGMHGPASGPAEGCTTIYIPIWDIQ